MFFRLLFSSLILLVSLSVLAKEPQTPEEYINVFQKGTIPDQISASKSLSYAGISSPQLFDIIEKNVLKYLPVSGEGIAIFYESWQTRALGYSGNEKYRATIELVLKTASRNAVSNHAKVALEDLDKYRQLNPVIVPMSWPESPYPSRQQRLVNMINSNVPSLQLTASMQAFEESLYQKEVLQALDSSINQNFQKSLKDDELDAVAWMCKALAKSRNLEYKATLEKVIAEAKEKKLRKYASSYMEFY